MKIAVLGAGHGGLATAGHIASKGHNVNLFSFYKQENAHPDGRRILENFFRMKKPPKSPSRPPSPAIWF